MELPALPINLNGYEHQVAGHGCMTNENDMSHNPRHKKKHNSEPQILHSKEECCVYKPIQAPPKHREVEFYQTVFGDGDSSSQGSHRNQQLLTDLQRFLPAFLGVFRHPISGVRYIKLHDLLHGFTRPSIMDIKMGAKIYQPNATFLKRSVEIMKYVHRKEIGFFVNGFRIWRGNDRYERCNKQYGMKVTPRNMHIKVIPRLMNSVPVEHRLRLLRIIIADLEALLAWFESQDLFHFYTSSILLGVECSSEALAQPYTRVPQAIVRMVDFPYIWPAEGRRDEGYLLGLRNLIRLCRIHEQALVDN